MLRIPTTFVIGAGASNPYGLPIGKELLVEATRLRTNRDLYDLVVARSQMPDKLREFQDELDQHTAQSIDEYLETRQTELELMKIGKYVIAALMGKAVQRFHKAQPHEDWLGYVFHKMREGVDSGKTFTENRVSFVTFNFDTIIENRFRADLKSTFRDPPLDFPPVIHVHGKLPYLPSEPMRHGSRDFHPVWRTWLDEAAANINVVLDAINPETRETARNAVLTAEIVCFLGFAYATPNLDRLGLLEAINKGQGTGEMFGSAFKMETGEQKLCQIAIAFENTVRRCRSRMPPNIAKTAHLS